jgi:riboflavin kinase/FMN adenylyltransferase
MKRPASPVTHSVVTIGNFDGVHLGHQSIIDRVKKTAQDRGGSSVVYTFRPHPQAVLRPQAPLQLILTYDEKIEFFEKLGVDVIVEEEFNLEFANNEPEPFFQERIRDQLRAEVVIVGHDFCFGKSRHGHLDVLRTFCNQARIELFVLPPYQVEGETVSSSKIRQCLFKGELEKANRFLGQLFFYRGIVAIGEKRGRTLGFPTANILLSSLAENKLVLPLGVYATWTVIQGQRYRSVTNLGVRPTFQHPDAPLLAESHLIDKSLDLYGQLIEIQFVRYLRKEIAFPSVQHLKAQITRDVEAAKSELGHPTQKPLPH